MPLQSKHSVVSTDEYEPRRIGIVTKPLQEPETGIEHRGSRDVADTQHGFDAFDDRRHAYILPGRSVAADPHKPSPRGPPRRSPMSLEPIGGRGLRQFEIATSAESKSS